MRMLVPSMIVCILSSVGCHVPPITVHDTRQSAASMPSNTFAVSIPEFWFRYTKVADPVSGALRLDLLPNGEFSNVAFTPSNPVKAKLAFVSFERLINTSLERSYSMQFCDQARYSIEVRLVPKTTSASSSEFQVQYRLLIEGIWLEWKVAWADEPHEVITDKGSWYKLTVEGEWLDSGKLVVALNESARLVNPQSVTIPLNVEYEVLKRK